MAWQYREKPEILAVCTPTNSGEVDMKWTLRFGPLMVNSGVPNALLTTRTFGIDFARNELVHEALNGGATKILFLDADVIPGGTEYLNGTREWGAVPEAVAALLRWEYPIVTGLVWQKIATWNIYLRNPDGYERAIRANLETLANKLFFVDAASTACLLVDARVFERVPYPWFKIEKHIMKERGPIDHPDDVGEDLYFFRQANKCGFRCLVEARVVCAHKFSVWKVAEDWEVERSVPKSRGELLDLPPEKLQEGALAMRYLRPMQRA